MASKKCPACNTREKADGRARCWDCLEDEMRKINGLVRMENVHREESQAGTNRASGMAAVKVPPDRVLVQWRTLQELWAWANLPEPKKPALVGKNRPGLKRHQRLAARLGGDSREGR